MEVEVVVPIPVQLPLPLPAMDFNFDSSCSTPYISAPSSPQRFGNFFYSAPTSPTTRAGFHSPSLSMSTATTMTIPFHWEESPGISKTNLAKNRDFDGDGDGDGDCDGEDFAFDFSGQLERPSVSADELFDKGQIKPLKPPPRLQLQQSNINGGFGGDSSDAEFNDLGNFKSAVSSPRSPISQGKKMIKEAFSPRGRRKQSSDFDPFEEALRETRQETESDQQQRGRERISASSSSLNSKFVRKKTRSLSPFRVSDILFGFGHDQDKTTTKVPPSPSSPSPTDAPPSAANSFFASFSFSRAYRKFKLKDLLLFRSASEGRATSKATMNKYEVLSSSKKSEEQQRGKDLLNKYEVSSSSKKSEEQQQQSKDLLNKYVMTSLSSKKSYEDVRNSSFRSTDSVGSSVGGGSVSSRRRGGGAPPLSAHELHYTVNRAVSEEMRKKTFLPYNKGLLGCLGFNPAVHDISRGGGSMTRV